MRLMLFCDLLVSGLKVALTSGDRCSEACCPRLANLKFGEMRNCFQNCKRPCKYCTTCCGQRQQYPVQVTAQKARVAAIAGAQRGDLGSCSRTKYGSPPLLYQRSFVARKSACEQWLQLNRHPRRAEQSLLRWQISKPKGHTSSVPTYHFAQLSANDKLVCAFLPSFLPSFLACLLVWF